MKKETLLMLILLCFFAGNLKAQNQELLRLKKELPLIQDSLRYVDVLNRLAMLYYEINLDTAFNYTKKARSVADRKHYLKGKADAFNNLGVFFDIKGNPQFALKYYNMGYLAYQELRDSGNMVQALMNIAMVYQVMGNESKSRQYFKSTLEEGKKLEKDSILSLAIYNNLLMYGEDYTADSLHFYIHKAQEIARKYQDYRVLIAIEQLIADDMIVHGRREAGLARLEKGIELALQYQLFYASMDMMLAMGGHLKATSPERSFRYFEKALKVAENNGYLIYRQIINRQLFEFFKDNNETKAIHYAQELIRLQEEQNVLNNESSIDYIDYALKDEELKSVQLHASDQRKLLLLTFAALLLMIVILFMIRKNLRRSRHFNQKMLQQNEDLKSALTALEESQADNTRMIKVVAHDLRNPIGGIYTLSGMMLDDQGRSEEDREILELIRTSGKHSLQLVDDLLHLQFKTELMNKELLELSEMVHYCRSLLLSKAEVKEQQILLSVSPVHIKASRDKLWRVLSNLMANAIKFSPRGSVIRVKTGLIKNEVHISVKDEGMGISPELGEKIFDLFTEAKREGTEGEESFGLGLAISRQIVEAHGGRIWYESEQGKGSVFHVSLPV